MNIQKAYVEKINAVNKNIPNEADLVKRIDYYDLEATKQDIKDWQESRLTALQYLNPDWTDYIRVLDDVMIDSHLTGIITTIKDIVKSKEFQLTDASGKANEEKKKLFETEWFFDFLDYAIDGYFYPYSVIQLGELKNDKFINLQLVKREYFVPQKTFVKKDLYIYGMYKDGIDGWNISLPNYNPYFITVYADNELGLLDRVAYHVLGKKHMLIYWWRYGEIFGIPMRIGKTDIHDSVRRKNMENMVSTMGSSMWAVVDPEDMVELVESKSSSNSINLFKDLMSYSNSEISKALIGTDSVLDEKSFVGSAEVGERLFELRQKAYLRKLRFIINNELIPRMIFYGLPLNGYTFTWVNEDKVSYEQKLETVKTFLPYFDFEDEEITEKFGFKVKMKNAEQNNLVEDLKQRQPQSVMKEVSALYKNIMAPLPEKRKRETKDQFIQRCMGDSVMNSEYPNKGQRFKVCQTQYNKK